MNDLVGKSVFVRTEEEYKSLLRIGKLQGFVWSRGNNLNPIDIPFPNMLNFHCNKTVTYRSDEKTLYDASDMIEDENKLREAITHVKYFANNKDRMALTEKVVNSMLLLADSVENQLEEVK